jgi:hypothetical protein
VNADIVRFQYPREIELLRRAWSRPTIKLPNAWERAHGDPSFADEHPCGRLGRSDLLLPFVEQMVLRSFFNIDD